jgi:hypothetical protein
MLILMASIQKNIFLKYSSSKKFLYDTTNSAEFRGFGGKILRNSGILTEFKGEIPQNWASREIVPP